MAKNVTEKLINQLNDLKVNKLIGSGSKRSLAAVVRKVQDGERWNAKAVAQLLDSAAERISIDQDREAVMALAAELAGNVPQAVQNGSTGTEAPTPAPRKGRGRKAAVTAVQGADNTVTVTVDGPVEPDYDGLRELLDRNDIETTVSADEAGLSLRFEHNGWYYAVWSPQHNMSGEDEWIVQYVPAELSGEANWEDERFGNKEADVRDWLVNDLKLTVPKRQASVRKPAQHSDTVRALVSSNLVAVESNAATALKVMAEFDNDLPADMIQALKDLKAAAANLRKTIIH